MHPHFCTRVVGVLEEAFRGIWEGVEVREAVKAWEAGKEDGRTGVKSCERAGLCLLVFVLRRVEGFDVIQELVVAWDQWVNDELTRKGYVILHVLAYCREVLDAGDTLRGEVLSGSYA